MPFSGAKMQLFYKTAVTKNDTHFIINATFHASSGMGSAVDFADIAMSCNNSSAFLPSAASLRSSAGV